MTSIASRFCSICLDTKSADTFSVLPCLHWFCRTCLSQVVQNVCPLCRSPFGSGIEMSSEPIDINILSRSAPSPGFRTPHIPSPSSILSRSAGNSVDVFESIINLTGLQNGDSLSRVLTELEQRERSQFRRRRSRRRRRLRTFAPPSPSPPSPSPPLSTSTIFQFEDEDETSDNESKTEEPETLPRQKSQNYGRGDRWAHLNRQRSNRGGR